ncbi:hypothetical protein [Roseococcus sp. YIM B11640]|uniref:hypothetical protein n=1 Tax=Roseococcus sp. YIM B11640 TaxID=3133973 RepID=UPI003C7D871C
MFAVSKMVASRKLARMAAMVAFVLPVAFLAGCAQDPPPPPTPVMAPASPPPAPAPVPRARG